MKNKKMIICDIDGTLAHSDTEVTEDMLEVISKLQDKYHFATIGNGPYHHLFNQFVKHYQEKVGKQLHIYTLGGLECYKTHEEGVLKIYSNELTNEEKYKIVRAISDLIREKGIVPDTYDQIEDRGSMIVFSVLGRKADKDLKKNYDPDKSKRRDFIENFLKERLPEFELKIGGTTTIDITRKGYTKAHGVKMMKEMFGVDFEDMIFFGDDLQEHGNDHAVREFVDVIEVSCPEETLEKFKSILEDLENGEKRC